MRRIREPRTGLITGELTDIFLLIVLFMFGLVTALRVSGVTERMAERYIKSRTEQPLTTRTGVLR